jgi:glycerate 2-kinase
VACAGFHDGGCKITSPRGVTVLVAPDSFKGSVSATDAAAAIGKGVQDVLPDVQVILHPVSDGGEGLVDILVPALEASSVLTDVSGPLPGSVVRARWGLSSDRSTAVMEMAQAAGLGLIPEDRRDPNVTTTYGVGELIRTALDCGARSILLGIGGSATNDGGAGMAQALGARFLDRAGRELAAGGAALQNLDTIDLSGLDPRLRATNITVACDVRNPLTGPTGASAVYGPQKGATPADVAVLDCALAHYRDKILNVCGVDVQAIPGSGAAGGLGAALVAFCGARLQSGIDVVLESTGFDHVLAGADLVITGEGRMDEQTLYGKALAGILEHAGKQRVPVAAIVGSLGAPREMLIGPKAFCAIEVLVSDTVTTADAIRKAPEHLRRAASCLVRLLSHRGIFPQTAA